MRETLQIAVYTGCPAAMHAGVLLPSLMVPNTVSLQQRHRHSRVEFGEPVRGSTAINTRSNDHYATGVFTSRPAHRLIAYRVNNNISVRGVMQREWKRVVCHMNFPLNSPCITCAMCRVLYGCILIQNAILNATNLSQ